MPAFLIPVLLIAGTAATIAFDAATKPKSVIVSQPQNQSLSFGKNEISLGVAIIAVIVFIVLVRRN